MPRIVLTAPALRDLDSIWDYIAIKNHNPQIADQLLDDIDEVFHMLALHPHGGRPIEEIVRDCRRFVVKGSYQIYYRPINDGIEVLRVLSSKRNIHKGLFLPQQNN